MREWLILGAAYVIIFGVSVVAVTYWPVRPKDVCPLCGRKHYEGEDK